MFCEYCGTKINDATTCPNCGAPVRESSVNIKETTYDNNKNSIYSSRSRIVTVLLAFLFGVLGIHNFYLGYKGKGITQLLLTTVGSIFIIGPLISGFWAFIDLVTCLISSDKTDADGNVLRGLEL